MNSLLIAGAGGHGKVIAEVAQAMDNWNRIAFLDDQYSELDGHYPWPVIDNLKKAVNHLSVYQDIIIAIGDAQLRLRLLDKYLSEGFNVPVLIHPDAWVSPSAEIGDGSVVFPLAAINASVKIGNGCIINTSATVDHDCIINDGVHICPGVHLGGEVTIGHSSWIGIGSNIIQQIHIGEQVTVGAGAAVISDIANGLTVAGVPANPV